MPKGQPKISSVNGYDVIEVSETVFKVYDDDKQYGPDFKTYDEASEHANTLPSRNAG